MAICVCTREPKMYFKKINRSAGLKRYREVKIEIVCWVAGGVVIFKPYGACFACSWRGEGNSCYKRYGVFGHPVALRLGVALANYIAVFIKYFDREARLKVVGTKCAASNRHRGANFCFWRRTRNRNIFIRGRYGAVISRVGSFCSLWRE